MDQNTLNTFWKTDLISPISQVKSFTIIPWHLSKDLLALIRLKVKEYFGDRNFFKT